MEIFGDVYPSATCLPGALIEALTQVLYCQFSLWEPTVINTEGFSCRYSPISHLPGKYMHVDAGASDFAIKNQAYLFHWWYQQGSGSALSFFFCCLALKLQTCLPGLVLMLKHQSPVSWETVLTNRREAKGRYWMWLDSVVFTCYPPISSDDHASANSEIHIHLHPWVN